MPRIFVTDCCVNFTAMAVNYFINVANIELKILQPQCNVNYFTIIPDM